MGRDDFLGFVVARMKDMEEELSTGYGSNVGKGTIAEVFYEISGILLSRRAGT